MGGGGGVVYGVHEADHNGTKSARRTLKVIMHLVHKHKLVSIFTRRMAYARLSNSEVASREII